MKVELTSAERKRLKAVAHGLDPVVMIGSEGLKSALLKEIDRSLNAHELIKIRAFSDKRDEREAWLDAICEQLNAAPVQHIGKVLVLFRENSDKKPSAPATPKRRKPRLTKRQEVNKALTRRKSGTLKDTERR
jgi:putative YhbY family RNA-binding protein